jgi:hypothetical protein
MSAQQDRNQGAEATFSKGKGKAQPQEDVSMGEDDDSSEEEESGVEENVSGNLTFLLDLI